jgi:selenocysteine lyase/cysteine desulfurase
MVRVIPATGGAVDLGQYTALINSRTKLVSVSQVSYKTGAQIPFLAALSQEAHRAGAVFCVDATQALGRVPVSIEGVDFLVASAYKWLLGIHGMGVAYVSPELRDRLAPGAVGWYSVTDIFTPDRFERYELKAGAG